MNRGWICFLAILMLSCNQSAQPDTNTSLWAYSPQNNVSSFDNACQPLLLHYQDLLKGVLGQDTAYLFHSAKNMATLMDSFPDLQSTKDSVLNNNLKQGLVNIHSEIDGLLEETSWSEIHKATNMISIQMIHLLAEAGYKNHSIYIFNTSTNLQEDGFHWFGFTKTTRDPYHPNQKEVVLAQQVLQEN